MEIRNGFITHLLSNAEVEETISRRREKLVGFGKTLQPFIIIVGPSLKEKYTYLVVVDNTFYHLNSITASVDCCFKIIIILNAEYIILYICIQYFFKYIMCEIIIIILIYK